jgi:multiple sugar transport system ATP-binding protein
MATVETRRIAKAFGEVRAVDGVDLATREGEFLVLLGPSGCGKTTLLRMIAGLERQTAGDVFIGGEKVNDLPPRDRKIAMVFQSYALYPHMTVEKNIAFPLKAQGVPRADIPGKVQWAASLFGIQKLLHRRPRELSGGERQRVALARALVREPAVFLLDEPLSNLDAKLRTSARDELQRFQRRVATTTLYVTHDQVEAMGLGDRIAVMQSGKVRQLATPLEVYDEPADTFVAGFIGSPPMNLIERRDYVLGIRPEHFFPILPGQPADGAARFPFRVTRVENLGADQLLYGVLEGQGAEAPMIAKSFSRVAMRQGEVHPFGARQSDLRFFDKSTGLRMDPGRLPNGAAHLVPEI